MLRRSPRKGATSSQSSQQVKDERGSGGGGGVAPSGNGNSPRSKKATATASSSRSRNVRSTATPTPARVVGGSSTGTGAELLGDISFMDTEPLTLEEEVRASGGGGTGAAADISFMDTEPVNFVRSEEEEDDEDNEAVQPSKNGGGRGGVGNPRPRPAPARPDPHPGPPPSRRPRSRPASRGAVSDFSLSFDTSEDDDDDGPSEIQDESPYDITFAPSYEVKRVYSELIDSCKGFENVTQPKDAEKILRENITTGKTLFRQLETTMNESMSESQFSPSQRRRQGLGNAAGDIYMAMSHTSICSKMLRQKVDHVGVAEIPFKIADFVDALRQKSTKDGQYSSLVAVRNLAIMSTEISNTASTLHTLTGVIDKDDLMEPVPEKPTPPPKEAKTRTTRSKKDDGNVTQTEVLKKDDSSNVANDTPENLANEIFKTVKTKYKGEGKVPINMLDVASQGAGDYHAMIQRLLGVAFCVRDGHFELSRDEGTGIEDSLACLRLKPAKPPVRGNEQSVGDSAERSQTIVSFPASALKKLFAASSTAPEPAEED